MNTFKTSAEAAKAMGIKGRKIDPTWAKSQKEKLARCPKCGGEMKYITGTNVLICENEVKTKDEEKTLCSGRKILNDGLAAHAFRIFTA